MGIIGWKVDEPPAMMEFHCRFLTLAKPDPTVKTFAYQLEENCSNNIFVNTRSEMDVLTFQYIFLACSIAIQRFITSQLVKDVPANFWDEDFFVAFAKEHHLADVFNEVQYGLPAGESTGTGGNPCNTLWIAKTPKQEQIEQISSFIFSKQTKSKMLDEAKKAKFRESFRIALETTIPLDEKEAQLIKKAKEAVASSDDLIGSEDAVYVIDKFSPLYNETGVRKRVLDSLAVYQREARNGYYQRGFGSTIDTIPFNSLNDNDTGIINEACSNGRFEAALNLAVARTEDNRSYLLTGGAAKLVGEILEVLRCPATVEKEYVRAKTRFANFENCQAKLPNFMNLYSICLQLRCERAKLVRLVDHLPQQYRDAIAEDLRVLDSALGISDESILRTGFFRWLKKEHFNNVQNASIELFESWVEDNPGEIGLALAHRAIYSAPDLSSLSKKMENLCSIEPFGAEEARCFPKLEK